MHKLARRGQSLLPYLSNSALRVLLLEEGLAEEGIWRPKSAMCINDMNMAGLSELIRKLEQLVIQYKIDEDFLEPGLTSRESAQCP